MIFFWGGDRARSPDPSPAPHHLGVSPPPLEILNTHWVPATLSSYLYPWPTPLEIFYHLLLEMVYYGEFSYS